MTVADAPALHAYRDDPDISRLQSWTTPFTLMDAERFIDGMADLVWPAFGEWFQVAIDLGGVMIGDVGVMRSSDGRDAEIGYTLAREYHGHGYATEAAAAIVDQLFAEGVQKVRASIDPANVASARVLERVGFQFEGTDVASVEVRGKMVDDARYAMTPPGVR